MRVAVSGYYGFGNMGDEALLAGLLSQLTALGAEPFVLSADPARTEEEHGVRAFHRYRELPGALRRADAVVSGGGGLLQDTTSARSLTYYLGVLRLARLLRRPAVVYGQSVGPLSPRGLQRTARVLRRIPVAVRDRQSRQLLESAGVNSTLVADPALLLSSPPREAVDVLLIPRAPYRAFSEALLAAGQEALSLGRSVGVLMIQPAEDSTEAGFLLAGLDGARALPAPTWQEALGICSAAGLVLSVRLHGLVFAAAARRPHAGLVYDPKVEGFLERSGGPVFREPVDVLAVTGLIAAPPVPQEDRLDGLQASVRAGADWLRTQLGGERC